MPDNPTTCRPGPAPARPHPKFLLDNRRYSTCGKRYGSPVISPIGEGQT